MIDEFKVGDRVRCIKDFDYIKNGQEAILELFNPYGKVVFPVHKRLSCGSELFGYDVNFYKDCFELVERKVGDIWLKPEELHIHENCFPPVPKYELIESGRVWDLKKNDIPNGLKKSDITYIYTTGPSTDFDKNKCGHTNYEGKEDKMETRKEFKVDKLGWYETKSGYKMKMVHKVNYPKYPEFIFVTANNDNCDHYSENGINITDQTVVDNIVKYIGPELPKKLRKFEFEASIRESPEENYSEYYPLEKALDHSCGDLFIKNYEYSDNENISKWKVTMEEIIE